MRDEIDEISNTLSAIASGDLTVSIDREYTGDFATIKDSINNISSSLNKTILEISSASEQVLTGASQISTSSMHLANGAQEQTGSVEELNTLFDLLKSQVHEDADSTEQAASLSNKSVSYALTSNNDMKQMLDAMTQIKES